MPSAPSATQANTAMREMLWKSRLSERFRDLPMKTVLSRSPRCFEFMLPVQQQYVASAPILVLPGKTVARLRFVSGEIVEPAMCGSRSSPFQMPARLADGLGLESGLGSGCPAPFAPSPFRSRDPGNLVPPRPVCGIRPD